MERVVIKHIICTWGGGGWGGDGVAALAMCGFAWADSKGHYWDGWKRGWRAWWQRDLLLEWRVPCAGNMASIFAGAKSIYGFSVPLVESISLMGRSECNSDVVEAQRDPTLQATICFPKVHGGASWQS